MEWVDVGVLFARSLGLAAAGNAGTREAQDAFEEQRRSRFEIDQVHLAVLARLGPDFDQVLEDQARVAPLREGLERDDQAGGDGRTVLGGVPAEAAVRGVARLEF